MALNKKDQKLESNPKSTLQGLGKNIEVKVKDELLNY